MEEKLTCHLCNAPLNLDDYDLTRVIPQLMKEKALCFQCAFWHNIKIEDDKVKKDSSMEIIPLITPDYRHYTIHFNSLWIETGTFRRERIKTSEKYIAILTGDNSMIINSYNNWGFQGIIPEHSRELFTPNGITLTPVELMELLSRKAFTSEDLKLMIQKYTENK